MAVLSAVNRIPDVETQTASLVGNAAAQAGRIPGGIAQGALKTLAAPGILYEAAKQNTSDYRKNLSDAQKYISDLRKTNPYLTQADLIDAKLAGEITQAQYDNYINEWQANGSPIDSGRVHGILERTGTGETVSKPITETTSKANTAVENWTNSWVPAPQSDAAVFVAKAADSLGEAIPATATAIATGGASTLSVMAGTTVSHAVGAANAFSTEMLEGSGDVGRALISGGTEWASEAIGGKLFNEAAANIGNKALSGAVDAIGEGMEEIISGSAQAALTGDSYSPSQALEEFALGAAVGGVMGAGANVVNSVSATITEGRVQSEVNARIADTAAADISDVQALISHSSDSAASAVVAQDSLTALQKQVTNPVNTTQTTTSIPSDIAQKYNLVPIGESSNGKPVTVKTQSYESIVAPEVAAMTAPEVSMEARAQINPSDATVINPRALYQYAQDVYLKPGTDLSDTMFTYRGQANQFYRTSQDAGSIPSSGIGTSWEGSGVYSAPTPYTTDLYGPSGKLADNPLANRGIDQTAIDTDYPVGVILQQSAGLTEDVSPLTRSDAPSDAVAEGTRRIRYDDRSRGFTTEIINNTNDVSASGLIFGRTGVADSIPIQYATDNVGASSDASVLNNISESATSLNSTRRQTSGVVIEENTLGTYTVPELINVNAVEVGINTGSSDEKDSTSLETAIGVASEAVNESWTDAVEGRVASAIPLVSTEGVLAEVPSNASQSVASPTALTPLVEVSDNASEFTVSTLDNSQSIPEVRAVSETPVAANATVTEFAGTQAEEATTEAVPKASESPEGTANERVKVVGESAGEELSSEELASQIWTPVQSMAKASMAQNEQRRKEREVSTYDFGITKGPGSRGLIDETSGYKTTFGGLSSF